MEGRKEESNKHQLKQLQVDLCGNTSGGALPTHYDLKATKKKAAHSSFPPWLIVLHWRLSNVMIWDLH